MKLQRVSTLLWYDHKNFIKSHWRWLEFLYFPITTVLIWGLFALWTGEFASEAGLVALTVNIFWSYAYVVQSTVNLTMNSDRWSGVLGLFFVTGLTKGEYVLTRILFSLSVSTLNLGSMLIVAQLFFFDILGSLSQAILLALLTAFLSIGVALFVAGLLFFLGRKFEWLAWTVLQLFVLISFPLIPLRILPVGVQVVASIMPFTALFEGVRAMVFEEPIFIYLIQGLKIGFINFLIGSLFYHFGFEYARKMGYLAK
jgi:hypothetical protein